MRIKTEPQDTEIDNTVFTTEYGNKKNSFVPHLKRNHDTGKYAELVNEKNVTGFENGLGNDYLYLNNDEGGIKREDGLLSENSVCFLSCKQEVEDFSYVTLDNPEVEYEVEVTATNEENEDLEDFTQNNGTKYLPSNNYSDIPVPRFLEHEDLNSCSTYDYLNAGVDRENGIPTYHSERMVPVIGEDDLEKQFHEVVSRCNKSSSEEATRSFMNALHLLDRVVERCFGDYHSQNLNNAYFLDESVANSFRTCKSPYLSYSSSAESTVTADETGDDMNITHCMGSDDVLRVMLRGASTTDQASQPDISDTEYSPSLQYAVEQQCITSDHELIAIPTEETNSCSPPKMQKLTPVLCESETVSNAESSDDYQIVEQPCIYNQDVQEEVVTTSTDLDVAAAPSSPVWLSEECPLSIDETVVTDNLPLIQLETKIIESFPTFFKVELGEVIHNNIVLTEEVTDDGTSNICTLNYLKTEETAFVEETSCLQRPSSLPNDYTIGIDNVPSKRHVKKKSKVRIKRFVSESNISSLPDCAIEEYLESTVMSSTTTYTSAEQQNEHDSIISDTSSACHFTKNEANKCFYCDKIFINKDKFKSHISAHRKVQKLTAEEKKFNCDICDIKFENLAKLISHLKRHTKDKNYDCETCKKSFSLSCFMNHQRVFRKLNM